MTLTWPWALLGLLALPVLVAGYRRMLRRQAARRADLARQGLVLSTTRHHAHPRAPRLARHLGPALLLGALALMLLALTRPVAAIAEPHREGTVILAFDVSTSMAAKDIAPTRLDAARAAARAFVAKQPTSVRIGVVAFGGSGVVSCRPTTDKSAVLSAISRLRPQGDTSLGGGILSSLSAIAGKPITAPTAGDAGDPSETAIGYYAGTAIVLLTDGENTTGPEPTDAADLASAAGVRIEPIGLGSREGAVLEVGGFSIATALDETMLRTIAETTGGQYHPASDAASLARVYDSISLQWVTRTVPHEVTSIVAGAAVLVLLAGAVVSVLRQGRVV